MGSKKKKEAIVLLLDVGRNMQQLHKSGTTFFQSSKDLISQIIQRKIFSNSADELGLILFGCEETKNCLSDGSGYQNIALSTEHLALPNWELLRYINDLNVNENCTADWLDAIIVAMQFIKDETDVKNFVNSKIVLFSNFEYSVCDDQVDTIICALNDMGINLVVIGPDLESTEYIPGKVKSSEQIASESLISRIVNEVSGEVTNFEYAFSRLMNFQRKNVRPMPWNTVFTISNKIKIPIRAFKKIAETTPIKWMPSPIDDNNAYVLKEKAFIKFDDDKEIEQEIEKEDVIDAYQFGTTIVPFSDIDQETMKFKSGLKGLYLIGFSPSERIPLHVLIGQGSYVILAKQDDDVAKTVLETFIQAMIEKDSVGVARKIYADNAATRIGALFPIVTQEFKYLVFTELPFAEDEHVYKFPSLSHVNASEEQNKAIDNLIEKMSLDETESMPEKFDTTEIYDHQEQYILRCISQKAIHPDKKLSEDIMLSSKQVLEPPTEMMESCQAEINRIKDLFPMKKVVHESKKNRYKKGQNNDENNLNVDKTTNLFQNQIRNNNDTDPSLQLDQPFTEVFQKQKTIIEDLVNAATGNLSKLVSAIKSLRQNCLVNDVKAYNDWINNLKIIIHEKNYFSMWNEIVNEKLGLITKLETFKSDVGTNEAEEFFKSDRDVDSLYGSQDTNSIEDLLNEI